MSTTIAVLGLGAMGLPTATHLAKIADVRGYDIAQARLDLAKAAGVTPAASAREAATGADIVLLAVRNGAQLEAALFGEDGVVAVLEPGAAVILTSTVGMAGIEAVEGRLVEAGVLLVDAPVSGGPTRAGDGTLLVTVGANDAAWAAAEPLLDHMAGTLVRVGDNAGAGQAMKTVNQLLCGIHIAAAGEAMALAGRLGLDPAAALDALMAGAAGSWMLGDRGPRAIQALHGEDAEVRSRLDIFVKDMGIVTDAAKAVGIATPLAAAAEQLYLQGLVRGMEAMDDSSVVLLIDPDIAK